MANRTDTLRVLFRALRTSLGRPFELVPAAPIVLCDGCELRIEHCICGKV